MRGVDARRSCAVEGSHELIIHFLGFTPRYCIYIYIYIFFERKGQLNRHTRYRPATTTRNTATHIAKGSVESTHKVPTSHYHTKHCHAVVGSLGGLTHRRGFSRIRPPPCIFKGRYSDNVLLKEAVLAATIHNITRRVIGKR